MTDYSLIATKRRKKLFEGENTGHVWVVNCLEKVEMPGLVMVKLIKVVRLGELEMPKLLGQTAGLGRWRWPSL